MAIEPAWRSPSGEVEVYRVSPRAQVREHLAALLAARRGTEPANLQFETGDAGKPSIAGGPAFSIAHVGDFSLIAVGGGRPIGIDAERVAPIPELATIASMLFAPEDRARIEAAESTKRERAFYRQWVALEAKVKARGEALVAHGPLDGLELHEFALGSDVVVALAVEPGPKVPVREAVNTSVSRYDGSSFSKLTGDILKPQPLGDQSDVHKKADGDGGRRSDDRGSGPGEPDLHCESWARTAGGPDRFHQHPQSGHVQV